MKIEGIQIDVTFRINPNLPNEISFENSQMIDVDELYKIKIKKLISEMVTEKLGENLEKELAKSGYEF